MARILEVAQSTKAARPEVATIRKQNQPSDDITADESDVPFIEVGADPQSGPARSTSRRRASHPAIIPMPQVRVAESPQGGPESSTRLFRVAFQPLPFPETTTAPAAERFAPELIVYHDPEHQISQQYREIAEQMRRQVETMDRKTLLFTSTSRGSGTTSVVLNLAMTLASSDLGRVLVVDANFDQPAVASRLGLASEPGLRDVLARTVPLVWGLKESGKPQLSVLPAGRPTAPVIPDLWPIVLDQLNQRFDWILIDGPLAGTAAWPAFAGTSAAAYLVWRQAELDSPELNRLLAEVSRSHVPWRGYILTQT